MFEVKPNQGIGPITLGMQRHTVAQLMLSVTGDAKHTPERDHYAYGKIIVEYENDQVISICVNRDPFLPSLEPELFGFKPLTNLAHETLMRVSVKGQFDQADPELGMSYIYPTLGVYLWRDACPESLEQELQLTRNAHGNSEHWYHQAQQDYSQFQSIGVFGPGYFERR